MTDDPSGKVDACPVNSHNEWDPLEEVVVGSLAGAVFPGWRVINEVTVPSGKWDQIEAEMGGGGVPYPLEMMTAAQRELDTFIHILEAEGVTVRHVDCVDYRAPFATPDWSVTSGFCASNPRDVLLVVGNEIIEAPMADRSRYFEAWAYRSLLKEYSKAGAKWSAAPKPQLHDALYDTSREVPPSDGRPSFIPTEFEPVFDAADFVRCGRDIFCQQSNTTNRFGIEWLQRYLDENYRIHILESRTPEAIHIDTTFMPLAPGKVLVNPVYLNLDALPPILRSWDLLIAPDPPPAKPLTPMSEWIGVNVLMLDEQRVIVEKRQDRLIRALKNWGFTPVVCSFEDYYPFLGSFHCATLDIRRRGDLQSYF